MLERSFVLRLVIIFGFFFFLCAVLSAQQTEEHHADLSEEQSGDSWQSDDQSIEMKEEDRKKYKPRKQNLLIDIPLAIAEISAINMTGNLVWRFGGPDSHVAYFTLDSIRHNLNYRESWHWEGGLGGDTFLTNQFFHPFAGGYYFASARSNNLGFYPSMLASIFGSIQFETFAETDMPAFNDTVSTVTGGIIIGEIIHRLFIELDKLGTIGRIGATILSPTDRITAAVRRYGPDESPLIIHSASLVTGFSWLNVLFFETGRDSAFWNNPSAFIDLNLVYGDPFTAHSTTPFDQFDLRFLFTVSPSPLVHSLSFVADGYIASWNLADDEIDQASNGLTVHNDIHSTDKGTFLDMNNGRDSIGFSAVSLDYSLKWCRIFNKSVEFSLKSHLGFTPWACLSYSFTYNGGENKEGKNLFSLGGNFKITLGLQQILENENKKYGHSFNMTVCFFRTWNWEGNPGFDNNSYFIFSNISYSFPFSKKYSLYIADSFQLMHVNPTNSAALIYPDITRIYNSVQVGLKISLL